MTGVQFLAWVRKGFSSLRHRVQAGSGHIQLPTQGAPQAPSPGVKRPEREADH